MGAFLPFSYLNVSWILELLFAATVVFAVVVDVVVAAHFGLTFKV